MCEAMGLFWLDGTVQFIETVVESAHGTQTARKESKETMPDAHAVVLPCL
jgi:hypothetical protein